MSDSLSTLEQLLKSHEADVASIVETLVNAYQPSIYRLALSILNDPDEAADAAQDTLIAATLKLDQYQAGTNFKAWLYTIAVNTCRGYLRKRKSRRFMAGFLLDWKRQKESPSTPEEATLDRETHSELWAAVNELGEKHRITVMLRFAHNLSIAEIAQVLDVKEKTIYTRLYDAFRKLKYRLGE